MTWEQRATFFIGHMVNNGMKSQSVRSYVSAIKKIVVNDGYEWDDKKVLLSTLTKACRNINDRIATRLAISGSLLKLILFELGRIFHAQPVLCIMYRAMFALGFYGLMQAGELTKSNLVVKACNVHIGTNKNKF